MQGCSELVGELHKDALVPKDDLVPAGKNWNTPFEFLWENARDGRLKNASAEDIWLVMEGPRPRVATESQVNSPLTRPSLDGPGARYRKSHVQLTMSVDEQLVELREAISAIAIAENFVMDENDVDFNFEKVERKELYVHMACSRLRNVNKEEDWTSSGCDQIVEFIIAVLTDLSEKNLLQKLFDQNDAQGRTILQIFVLCELNVHVRDTWGVKSKCSEKLTSAFGKMLAILPERCVNTLDKAGRTVLHWAVAHHSTWAVDELLRSGKANPAITFSTACYQQITAFNLLLLHEYDLNWYRFPLNNELNRRFGLLSFPGGPLLRREEDPVSWAILMGKKKFVEQVMERQVICPHLCTSLTLTLICSTA
ncbi:unnamed protein product [Sphagnum jensenii]|uniref:Uncharacterized protein n=1 Tax=Sphagnum jensenii TaxID=128206 RepID=A0ABP0W4Z0_9BRYO